MPVEGIRTLHVLSVSDTHGWIYGHAHQREVGNYGLLTSYIEHMHDAAARDPSADVLAIDGGDIIEGTGLSDVTDVRGKIIYSVASRVPFDIMTIGNHDMDNSDSATFLSDHSSALFGDRFISTNTYRNNDGAPLIQHTHKYLTLKNGLRALVFSFLFHGMLYEYGHTKPPAQVIKSNIVQDILNSYKHSVDILIVNNHMASEDSEWGEIYAAFRAYYDAQNYTIPMLFLASHSHILVNQDCPFPNATQCYIVEAGCYLEHLQHVTYMFLDVDYESNGETYRGVQMAKIVPNLPTDFTYANSALRLNIPENALLTKNGLAIQEQIDGYVAALDIMAVIGYSPHEYNLAPPYNSSSSLYSLWTEDVVPSLLFSLNIFDKTCRLLVTPISGYFRESLYEGNITLDDTYTIFPFRYVMSYLNNVTYDELSCVVNYMNSMGTGNQGAPLILLEEDISSMDRSACYNIILTSHESRYISLAMGKGGPCHNVSDPLKSYVPKIIYVESDVTDNTSGNITMGDLLRTYIKRNMPIKEHDGRNRFLSVIIISSFFGIMLVITLILVLLLVLRKYRLHRRAAKHSVKTDRLVYDSDTITTESVTEESK
ncbi:5' nucleotidase family protein [Giardia lamblia P15]|uniref:5' nucleotidase family protein n=1 Tax=Giardia intestinalis (strain P15) TaxID=658858 RepID=E1F1C2_GIAIA|nr:5' nucleotidase family protein [Giardia lamblia P15]